VHKCGANGHDAEAERYGGDIPPGTYPFASHIGRDFKNDVGYVEDGEDGIVIVAFQVEFLFEPGEPCISCLK
jgi:hypothetical protein